MATNITGDPTIALAPSGAPALLGPVVLRFPDDPDARNAASIRQISAASHWLELFRRILNRNFGDANLGNLVVSSSVTPAGINYPQYDELTINSGGGIYSTQGKTIRGRKLVWNGLIRGNGNNAAGASGGDGSFHSAKGPNGGLGAGLDGPPVVCPYNAGGAPNWGGDSGATQGGDGSLDTFDEFSWLLPPFIYGLRRDEDGSNVFSLLAGGRAGGAGAGDGANNGGAAGASASGLVLLFNEVEIGGTATWEAKGGNGATGTGGNAGGGGGGDGGFMLIVCGKITGTPPAGTVTGGTAGAGSGTGTAGQAGSVGRSAPIIIEIGEEL